MPALLVFSALGDILRRADMARTSPSSYAWRIAYVLLPPHG